MLTRNADLVMAEMDGDLVMMHVESGVYFGLTGIAPKIWESLENPMSFDDLIESMLTLYEVERDVLANDLRTFIDNMQEHGLLTEQ